MAQSSRDDTIEGGPTAWLHPLAVGLVLTAPDRDDQPTAKTLKMATIQASRVQGHVGWRVALGHSRAHGLEFPARRPIAPMRIGWPGGAILLRIAGDQDLGEQRKGFGLTWELFLRKIQMLPGGQME